MEGDIKGIIELMKNEYWRTVVAGFFGGIVPAFALIIQTFLSNRQKTKDISLQARLARLAQLNVKSVEPCQQLYADLYELRNAIANYVSFFLLKGEALTEKEELFAGCLNKAKDSLMINGIFLSTPLYRQVDSFIQKINALAIDFLWVTKRPLACAKDSKAPDWKKINESAQNEIPSLLKSIHEEMRRNMGWVDSNPTCMG